jgi:hypothetical protein
MYYISGHKILFTTHPALLEQMNNSEAKGSDDKNSSNDNSEEAGSDIIKTGSDVTKDIQSCDLKTDCDSDRCDGTKETTT